MLPWGPPAESNPPPSRGGADDADADLETYLLLLLSDSNLPTGGFVASSGLESYHAHGFLHNVESTSSLVYSASNPASTSKAAPKRQQQRAPSQARLSSSTLSFTRSTLHSYARSAVPLLVRAHAVVRDYCARRVRVELERQRKEILLSDRSKGADDDSMAVDEDTTAAGQYEQASDAADLDAVMASLAWLDEAYHTLLLNHVARRASKAQGIALLTLYTKAFARPINLDEEHFDGSRLGLAYSRTSSSSSSSSGPSGDPEGHARAKQASERIRIEASASLVERLKRDIRKTAATPSLAPAPSGRAAQQRRQEGHFPLCWAVFAACLGLSAERAVQLHLFLQARSLLSSSIRLNTLGPYLAHQLMRFQLRDVVQQIVDELKAKGCLSASSAGAGAAQHVLDEVAATQEGEGGSDAGQQGADGYRIGAADDDDEEEQHTPARSMEEGATPPQRPTGRSPKPTRSGASKISPLRMGKGILIPVDDSAGTKQGWAWDWPEDSVDGLAHPQPSPIAKTVVVESVEPSQCFWSAAGAPATTYPLGEIVQARHDQLHSRLFNS